MGTRGSGEHTGVNCLRFLPLGQAGLRSQGRPEGLTHRVSWETA